MKSVLCIASTLLVIAALQSQSTDFLQNYESLDSAELKIAVGDVGGPIIIGACNGSTLTPAHYCESAADPHNCEQKFINILGINYKDCCTEASHGGHTACDDFPGVGLGGQRGSFTTKPENCGTYQIITCECVPTPLLPGAGKCEEDTTDNSCGVHHVGIAAPGC